MIYLIFIFLLLSVRTWKYKYLIDDQVSADQYGFTISDSKFDPAFYKKRRPIKATVKSLIIYISIIGYIYYYFGWFPALFFTVFPLNVFSYAWITGSYYSTTLLLLLGSHYFLTDPSLNALLLAYNAPTIVYYLKIGVSLALWGGALNSTVSSIPYLIIALFYPYGWTFIIPFLFFLFGKRMQTGIRLRKEVHANQNIKAGFKIRNLLNIPKTLACYLYTSCFPSRMGLFWWWGKGKDFGKPKTLIVCGIVVLLFFNIFLWVDWRMCLGWFLFMGLYSQWTTLGQFTTERYTIIPNLFFCVIVSKILSYAPESLSYILATLYFYRSHLYVKAFENNGTWMTENARMQDKAPEPYNNLANLLLDDGQHFKAITPLLMALKYCEGGQTYNLHANLSVCYAKSGMYEKALYYTMLAINDPNGHVKQKDTLIRQKEDLELKLRRIQRQQKELRRQGII